MSIRNLRGRPEIVVITGASAGVGRATARAFADARRPDRPARAWRRAPGSGPRRKSRRWAARRSLTRPTWPTLTQVEDAADARRARQFGPIDVWVNNAMASVFSPVKEMTADEFRRVTDVTYLGYVHGTLAALRRMLPRDRGAIVQVGSALAYRSHPAAVGLLRREARHPRLHRCRCAAS